MARRSDMLAIEFDGTRLLGARMSVASGKVVVRELIESPAPEGLDRADAAAIGAWLGRVAAEKGLSLRRVVFVVGREEIILKRMNIPGGAGLNQTELAGLVRLSLSRQMTVAIDGAGIDFIRLDTAGEESGAATVVAAALPADRLAWYRAVAGAAGARVGGIQLAISGISAIARGIAARHDGPALCITLSRSKAEFLVLESGQIATARAVEIGAPHDDGGLEQYAARVVVEARRTWMGWTSGREGSVPESLLLFGDADLAERVRARSADASLASQVRVASLPPGVLIEPDTKQPADVATGAFQAIIGVGFCRAESHNAFDFAVVKKGPDPKARLRQLTLAGAFSLILLLGGAWVLAQMRLAEYRESRDTARAAMNRAGTQYADLLVQEVRAESVERWAAAGMDWLGHLTWLSDQMPDPKDGQLDEVSAIMSADVEFVPRDRSVAGALWTTRQQAVFSLSGRVIRREIALDLRGRLVRGDLYKVVNQSADTEDRFSFDLVTSRTTPSDSAPSAPATKPDARPALNGSVTAPGGRGT
ncbi:MAG: pilus assembly protein PilM [Phycisphaeraceae bacterium]|nr:pilus assembly protein PilM [Phycisphaeraceae bacterium]